MPRQWPGHPREKGTAGPVRVRLVDLRRWYLVYPNCARHVAYVSDREIDRQDVVTMTWCEGQLTICRG